MKNENKKLHSEKLGHCFSSALKFTRPREVESAMTMVTWNEVQSPLRLAVALRARLAFSRIVPQNSTPSFSPSKKHLALSFHTGMLTADRGQASGSKLSPPSQPLRR